MIHFTCPHCGQDHRDDDLYNQEVVMIENPVPLGNELLTIDCFNCHEPINLVRTVAISFEVQ